jgi:hypothetical protein
VVGDDFAKEAAAFKDNLDKIGIAATGVAVALGGPIIRRLREVTDEFVEGVKKGEGFLALLRSLGQIAGWTDPAGVARDREFIANGDRLLALQTKLGELQSQGKGDFGFSPGVQNRISQTKAEIATLQGLVDQEVRLRRAERGEFGDAHDRRAASAALKVPAPIRDKRAPGAAGTKAKDPEVEAAERFAKALSGLQVELAKTGSEGSKYAEVLSKINAGEFGALNEAQKRLLIEQAAQIDQKKESVELEKEITKLVDDYQEKQAENTRNQNEQLEQQAEAFRQLIDPTREYAIEQEKLAEVFRAGKLEFSEFVKASEAISTKQAKALEDATDKGKDAKSVYEDLGVTFESAFEKAVGGAEKAGAIMKAIINDIAKLATRELITKPASEGIGGFFKSILPGLLTSLVGGGSAPVGSGNEALDIGLGQSYSQQGVGTYLDPTGIGPSGVGAAVNVTNYYTIDSRTDAAYIQQAVAQASESNRQQILADITRGGQFSRAVRAA